MVLECIMLAFLLVGIIMLVVSMDDPGEIIALLIALSFMWGLIFVCLLMDLSGVTVQDHNHKGYNVWKEETKIGDKVVETTWHVAPKK